MPETEWLFTRKPAELFSLVDAHKPDVVLMELLFEDVHGFELLKRMKTRPDKSPAAIIIFSKLDDMEDIQKAMSCGATGYFVKGKNSIGEVRQLILSLS